MMLLTKLRLAVQKTATSAQAAAFRGLLSPGDLRLILQRERARADRSGNGFSLVAFSAGESPRDRARLAPAARILKGRLRATDELGWLGDRRIGAVLPGTTVEGAWTVAGDVFSCYPAGVPLPEGRVYFYPGDKFFGDERRSDRDAWQQSPRGRQPVHAMEPLLAQATPAWKRSLDLAVAAAGLIALLPLLAAVAVAIKWTSPGPVLFKQRRSGRGGKPFVMYKFRSMIEGAERVKKELVPLNEQDGPAFKIKTDPRVTPVGRVLRASSIDELPQLWNVLRGEMSLVGPRPLPCKETDACHGWQRRRLEVTPGLTCFWQTCDRRFVTFKQWMRMDVRYLRSRSFWQDLRLIWATVGVVFRGGRW